MGPLKQAGLSHAQDLTVSLCTHSSCARLCGKSSTRSPSPLRAQSSGLFSATDVGGAAQTGTFFKRSMLWIWGISQVVLFAPFMAGAALEQATGIWCACCSATNAATQTIDCKIAR